MGALILNLCPSCSTFLQYDECLPLWFCFRLLPPMQPAHVSCIPTNHGVYEPYRGLPSSRFHLALCDWRQHRCFLRYLSSFFLRHYLLSCCCCWTFPPPWHTSLLLFDLSRFLAYFFPPLTSLQFSPNHLILRHSSYCYRLWSHVVDHWLHIESLP